MERGGARGREGEERGKRRSEWVEGEKEKFTKVLVQHGLLLLFITLFIHQRAEGIPENNQPTNQSINQSANKPIINQPINQSTNQPTNYSTNHPTNQSTNQSINQSTIQPINQSTHSLIGPSSDRSRTPDLWLLADGRHRNMITIRIIENRKRQKASSIHSSPQS